jgi:lipoic acid synthetase
VLTSDFCGSQSSLDKILNLRPEVFNHNIETVRRLTPKIRHKATYERTLQVLNYVKKTGGPRFIKSGIMAGLGETSDEVKETLKDLKQAGCDIVTIGHYLQASRLKIPVKAFVSPEMSSEYADFGLSIGIPHMYCGPFVRSSYNADLILKEVT